MYVCVDVCVQVPALATALLPELHTTIPPGVHAALLPALHAALLAEHPAALLLRHRTEIPAALSSAVPPERQLCSWKKHQINPRV